MFEQKKSSNTGLEEIRGICGLGCNNETLEVLIENDIQFTVLSPHQSQAVRSLGSGDWTDVRHGKLKNLDARPGAKYELLKTLINLAKRLNFNMEKYDEALEANRNSTRRKQGIWP